MPPIEPYQVTKNRHCSATIQNVGEIDRYAPKLVRYRRHWIAPLDEVGGLALGRYTGLYGFSRLVLFLIKPYSRLLLKLFVLYLGLQ